MQQSLLISCLESRIEDDGTMYGRFLFGALPRGLATTIATALRRSLLSEVSGWAITHAEFFDIPHEYSTLPGTQETVFNVLLNLKKLIFSSTPTQSRQYAIGYCSGRGPGVLTGRDLKLPPGFHCTNPDQVIATLATDGHLQFSFLIGHGKQYTMHGKPPSPQERRPQRVASLKESFQAVHTEQFYEDCRRTMVFPVDAVYMPVLRVSYMVHSDEDVFDTFPEVAKFGSSYHYLTMTERVTFEVWTNGAVTPRDAIDQAARHLIQLFSNFQISLTPPYLNRPQLAKTKDKMFFGLNITKDSRLQAVQPNQFLNLDIGILPISPPVYAALKAHKMQRLVHFLDYSCDDLYQIPGMTSEALFEILASLRRYGIQFFPPSDSPYWKVMDDLKKEREEQRQKAKRAAYKAQREKEKTQKATTTTATTITTTTKTPKAKATKATKATKTKRFTGTTLTSTGQKTVIPKMETPTGTNPTATKPTTTKPTVVTSTGMAAGLSARKPIPPINPRRPQSPFGLTDPIEPKGSIEPKGPAEPKVAKGQKRSKGSKGSKGPQANDKA